MIGSACCGLQALPFNRPPGLLATIERTFTPSETSDGFKVTRALTKGVPHCPQELPAFRNHSTRSFARCVVWSLWPGPGVDTENLFHTGLDCFPPRRAACEVQDRWRILASGARGRAFESRRAHSGSSGPASTSVEAGCSVPTPPLPPVSFPGTSPGRRLAITPSTPFSTRLPSSWYRWSSLRHPVDGAGHRNTALHSSRVLRLGVGARVRGRPFGR